MIEPAKLFQLSGGQKRRKLALTFGALERDIAGIAEKGTEYSFKNMPRAEYTRKITEILLQDPKLDKAASDELRRLLDEKPFDELRVCNCARNHLLALIGTFPAEWDLVIAPHESPVDENGVVNGEMRLKRICYTDQQLDWLVNRAMTAPADYNYIFISHMGIDSAVNSNRMLGGETLR